MKLELTIANKKFGIDASLRNTDYYAFRVKMQELKNQMRIWGNGKSSSQAYNNCQFGQPFPVTIPVEKVDIKGNDDDAIKHISTATGLPVEHIQRALEMYHQYYRDKNIPPQQP